MSLRKDLCAIGGMLCLLVGLAGTVGFGLVMLGHIIREENAAFSMLCVAGSLAVVLMGSGLMEVGGVDPTPNKRGGGR